MEYHILKKHDIKDSDKLSIKEAKEKLMNCPICKSKAYISKDIIDGFYFGWSVGCPRFCLNDGIHDVDEESDKEKHLSIFGLDSAKECVELWNKKCKSYFKKGDTIKCHDKDDMIETMYELQKAGIETDFIYEKDGVKGLWLIVTNVAVLADTTNTKI